MRRPYFFAHALWANLPRDLQFLASRCHAALYRTRFSRWLIGPYVKFQYQDPEYLRRFAPASGRASYATFQDFFTRRLTTPPPVKAQPMWPCDGLVCDLLPVDGDPPVRIKGELRRVRDVFGPMGRRIPKGYMFSNVFLHNRDYHRVHAPVSGVVRAVERAPGALRLLRPWAYPKAPSLPAMTNERVNVEIETDEGVAWWLSIVGGPGVATIRMADVAAVGGKVRAGQELATFLIGSTCCVAGPVSPQVEVGSRVLVGMEY